MKRVINWFVLAGLFLATSCDPSWSPHDAAFNTQGLMVASDKDLTATIISPSLATPLEAGKNVLWCGTFQLAWNEVCGLVGEDPHFANEPAMVSELNRKEFSKADLDDESYLALAGFVRDGIFGKIDRGLKDKFKGQASPHLLPRPELTPRPQDIVAYSYLFKNLQFGTPFERLQTPMRFADGNEVAAFGMLAYKPAYEKMYPQVQILDYRSREDFIIELKTKSVGDRVILARVKPGRTLGETLAAVLPRIAAAKPASARAGDLLCVPKLNFDLTRDYRELLGRTLIVSNPKVAKDLTILSAVQNIRFQFDEEGVRLRSESHLSFGCGVEAGPVPEHIMVFDGPFLILMRRTTAKVPYFALWVGNSDLLVKPE
jgi:hypothetical protein